MSIEQKWGEISDLDFLDVCATIPIMKDRIPDKLTKNEYYHGTSVDSAIQILYEGFRFKKDYSNYGAYGTFKQGLYLTKSLSVASLFGSGYVFKCQLDKGVSILWLNGDYNQNVIDYLKREFSKSILVGPISKAIPRNKHLTKNELIHLLNCRFSKTNWSKSKEVEKWRASKFSFRQQLLLHKYDGVGETEEEAGVVIFNPSYVKPVELFCILSREEKTTLEPLNPQKLNTDVDIFCKDMEEYLDSKEKIYIRSLQERFRLENGLILT